MKEYFINGNQLVPIDKMDWQTMVTLHYGTKADQRKLAKYLEERWAEAREEHVKMNRSFKGPYGALQELYSVFGKSDPSKFMGIIIFSMRQRGRLGLKDQEKHGTKITNYFLQGWWACQNEWDRQANPSPKSKKDKKTERMGRRDSLTELILNYEDLRKSDEFLIAATLQRVRRLRKASDEDTYVLDYSNSLLKQAQGKWKAIEQKQQGGRLQENFLACPNEMIGTAITMQIFLNGVRLANHHELDIGKIEDQIKEIERYHKTLQKAKKAEIIWSQTYKWWFLRIIYRLSQKRLDWEGAENAKKRMDKLEEELEEPHKEYLEELVKQQSECHKCGHRQTLKSSKDKCEKCNHDKFKTGRLADSPYFRLNEYHLLLSRFIHYPTARFRKEKRAKYPPGLGTITGARWFYKKTLDEERRYLEYAAFPRGTTLRKQKGAHQFIDTTHKPPINLLDKDGKKIVTSKGAAKPSYSDDWREDRNNDSLIQRCRNSITNSQLMTLNIASNNSHIAPPTLMLNAIDLMIKIRWLLASPPIYYSSKGHKKKDWMLGRKGDDRTFRKDNELKISEGIREALVRALRDIEDALLECGATKPGESIQKCRKSIEKLDLAESDEVSPLGRICAHLGKILGWEWQRPNKDLGREKEMYEEYARIQDELDKRRKKTYHEVSPNEDVALEPRIDTKRGKEEEVAELEELQNKLVSEIKQMQTILLLKDPDTGDEMIRIDGAPGSNKYPYLRPVGENASIQ